MIPVEGFARDQLDKIVAHFGGDPTHRRTQRGLLKYYKGNPADVLRYLAVNCEVRVANQMIVEVKQTSRSLALQLVRSQRRQTVTA